MNAPTQAVRILGDNPTRPISIAILAMGGQGG